ncbi:phosphate butyryltransferase [Anaerobacillus sp. MEB173]|uniref:phosphate butyryltransferase n=1 Tax=Anaerobacillus sp. MEB173 TaxID=3383345 RepID=UPI003F92D406
MKLEQLIDDAKGLQKKIVAVAAAHDEEVIAAVAAAVEKGLASFILFGNEEKIKSLLHHWNCLNENQEVITIIHTHDDTEAAQSAVRVVHEGKAHVLMKGMVATAVILKAVLNKEFGLRTGNVLSHVAAFEVNGYERLLFITDAAMNISPDLKQKMQIITNAVEIARKIGVETPKVAPVSAVEVVNPDMAATLDAAALTQMNKRGQVKNCIIDGPLALDNAVSLEAAQHKGIQSDVAGQADILLVPSIEVGNVLYKSLVYFANAKVGGIIAGAKAPIVLTSRADSAESKLYSIALAVRSAY